MADGIIVPILGVAILAAIWAVLIYGPDFFGPKAN